MPMDTLSTLTTTINGILLGSISIAAPNLAAFKITKYPTRILLINRDGLSIRIASGVMYPSAIWLSLGDP